jgi:hypothetical protein
MTLLGLGAVVVGGLMLSPSTVGASSHREAPLIASDPAVDILTSMPSSVRTDPIRSR